MPVVRVQVEVHQVGERVLLRIDCPLRHRARQVGDIDEHRLETEPAERRLVLRVVERAQPQPDAVGRRADRPHGVADMADAVVPPAQHAIGGRGRHPLGKRRAGIAIQSGEHRLARAGLERLVERAECRHPGGEIARGEIAAVEFAALHHAQQVGGLAAGGDDAVGHRDRKRAAGAACHAVAQGVQRARVDGAGGLIAGEVECDHVLCMAQPPPSCHGPARSEDPWRSVCCPGVGRASTWSRCMA